MKKIILVLSVFLLSCGVNKSVSKVPMNDFPKEESILLTKTIEELKKNLQNSMLDYLASGTANFKKEEVTLCISIIDEFLVNIKKTTNKNDGMKEVKKSIFLLNDLNKTTNGSLIETNERELIAAIFILAGNEKGYNDKDEDITEEWREW